MLTIDVEKADDVAVVHCGGRLVRGAEVCNAEKRGCLGENHAHCGARSFATGVHGCRRPERSGVIASLVTHNHGIQLKLVNPSAFVREMLTRTRLNRVFDISSLHDALRVLSDVDCSSCEVFRRIPGSAASSGGEIKPRDDNEIKRGARLMRAPDCFGQTG